MHRILINYVVKKNLHRNHCFENLMRRLLDLVFFIEKQSPFHNLELLIE